jgi:uncharacterized membrane protein YphA (DoxX/SURF4 family)
MPTDSVIPDGVISDGDRPARDVDARRYGWSDLAFRALFSSIFVGLGAEHVFADDRLQVLMPAWVPWPRAASIALGVVLLTGGASILLGYRVRQGALGLGAVVVVVTLCVNLPGLFHCPASVDPDSRWLWDMFQRSNFVKNLCLLGVCIHLAEHRPGRFSLDHRRARGPKR